MCVLRFTGLWWHEFWGMAEIWRGVVTGRWLWDGQLGDSDLFGGAVTAIL